MEKVVFTNGCFDIIHPGHIDLLERAKQLGTKLIVGINSDSSVRAIRGGNKPFVNQEDRKAILLGLKPVDQVKIFDELTPENLIQEIKPDVLVKGGDWGETEIIGADFVKKNGGKVFSLPLKDGYSTTSLVEKIRKLNEDIIVENNELMNDNDLISNTLKNHIEIFERILHTETVTISKCADLIYKTIESGNKLLICGNGGSAADSQHIATEFVGRYETERRAIPAIALTTDTSLLTAVPNDYEFERVFARQVEALAKEGDLLIAISTSGNSPNVISAAMTARKLGCKVLGMTGAKGKKLASLCDECFLVPEERTARIQEAHISVAHIWCEIVDKKIAENNS